jgi:hypothetical protein
MPEDRIVRIGGASGAFVDSALAVPQLLGCGDVDYLVFDYLAEGTMSLFGKLQAMDPKSGYMSDFVDVHIAPNLAEIKRQGVKIVANAGGLNPRALAETLSARARALDVHLRICTVEGDDLRSQAATFRSRGVRDMFSGAPFPSSQVTSVNAYLGAFPVAAALAQGADIVVTGRVVDSALILGPLIHEFGWREHDYDLLAAGTAAGHLLECGAQVTGGTFTDWRLVPRWEDAGYPIGECRADGTVVITKPPGTGGLVSVGTVAEQLLYEVSDPQCYFVPDVVCDFSGARLAQIRADAVRVSGVRGYPPTATYKVCVTYDDGWKSTALIPIIGIEAAEKAERQAAAIIERTRKSLKSRGMADLRRVHVEILGNESTYGAQRRVRDNREIVLKIAIEHEDRRAGELFWREQTAAIMSMSVGTTIALAQGTPMAMPVTHLFSFLTDKSEVPVTVTSDGAVSSVPIDTAGGFHQDLVKRPVPGAAVDRREVTVRLIDLAWARSGDKGDLFNVGVIARRPEYLPFIRAALTSDKVAAWYGHFLAEPESPRVDRYEVPGFHAFNFVVHDSLGGGINSSLRLDSAAKGMAQQLLEFPIPVSRAIAETIRS